MLWWFWRRAELCSTAPVTALSLTLRQLRANLQAEKTAQSTVLTSHHYSASGTVILTNRTHHRNTGGIKKTPVLNCGTSRSVGCEMTTGLVFVSNQCSNQGCDCSVWPTTLQSEHSAVSASFFINFSWSKLKTGCFLTFSNQSTFLFILKWKDWKWSLYLSPPVINVSRLFSDWHCESCGIKNMMAALKLT